ncbi:MAG: HEAT repeat domain-containing protein [Nitrospira sp.]
MNRHHSRFVAAAMRLFPLSIVSLCLLLTVSMAGATPKDDVVDQFVAGCIGKPAKAPNCATLRPQFVEILKEDLLTLGSSADRKNLPDIARMFRSDEVEIRLAAAHAIGMIGPEDQDVDLLIPLTNDPVPDVRHAVSNMITRGKGKAMDMLKERILPLRTGREVEKPADAGKFSLPVMPDSVYIFDSSDAVKGRLSYVARGKGDPAQFYKSKAKKGPFKLEQFKEQYRYQLRDEEEALNDLQRTQIENEKAPDPKDMQAYLDYIQRMGSLSTQGGMGRTFFDTYQSNLYGAPTVYVLEERQIGQRCYPTRYVVVYQDSAFKRPGYRLNWTTVPDNLLKTAQTASLAEEKEELANKAESEALKKKAVELEAVTKKKEAADRQQFKKGQEDLEKALGF